jgi:hypothetical protein
MPGRAIAARLGRDGAAGVFVVVAGAILWLIVRNYPRGELSQFGPGYLPWIASIGMMLLGAAIIASAYRSSNNAHEAQTVGRPVVIVPLGMLVFAFGLEPFGLFVTSALGVFVTTFASRESALLERALLALGLATLVTIVFGYGIGMTVPLAPPFLRP